MKIVSEFKEFISRGNVIDLAVGIIIGSAFTGIVDSLVKDVIMPFIGVLLQGVDFTNLKWTITGDASIAYGNFIQKTLNFVIIAIVVFSLVKIINKFHIKNEEEKEKKKKTPAEVKLLREIRDLLKTKKK
jgi:large conductance mechanosensitive channel